MKTIIRHKEFVAEGTLQVTLGTIGEVPEFQAGQYMMVSIHKPIYSDDKGATRFFSIASSPDQKGELVFTTRLSDSAFKRTLAELPIESSLEVEMMGGDLVLPESAERPLVFITGGIGITPFISMLRYVDKQKLNHKITLLYSNRTVASTAYLDELKAIAKRNKNIKVVPTMTDDSKWHGETKKIDAAFIRRYVENVTDSQYFLTGSERMVEAISKSLSDLNVPLGLQHTEVFPGY